jgi:S-adenosylmethionine-dependent methyltransferase
MVCAAISILLMVRLRNPFSLLAHRRGQKLNSKPVSRDFAAGEQRWLARLGKLRDVVRQELIGRQLAAHLPGPPLQLLDIGCGQGTQALRLARLGYKVTGLDPSAMLLGRLEEALAAEAPPVRDRVRLVNGAAEQLTDRFRPGSFGAVLCHGVLMYLADPEPVLDAIAAVVAPAGMVSLLVRNGEALAMRPGLLGDWAAAEEAFEASTYRNRIGLRARADRLDDLAGSLAGHGLPLRAWYGVRVFTDTAADGATAPGGDELAALLACEERAGRTDPYRRVAALLHLIAVREAGVSATATPGDRR